jgi:hypothetical protein
VNDPSRRDERTLLKVYLLLSAASALPYVVAALLKYLAFFTGRSKISVPWSELVGNTAIVLPILWYFIAFAGTYAAIAGGLWALYLPLARTLGGDRRLFFARAVLLFLAAELWLLLLHAHLLPNASFAAGTSDRSQTVAWAFWGLTLLLGTLTAASVLLAARPRVPGTRGRLLTAGVGALATGIVIAVSGSGSLSDPSPRGEAIARERAPDVIIIGIDSLRPDYVHYLGFPLDITPNLDRFLAGAAVFPDTLTPLARTFPSWVSILTGLNPIHHGARFNLEDPERVQTTRSIAHEFRRLGYLTAYATDETRFSNINGRYGFDRLLTPSTGALDFLLGTAVNSPATDILTASRLGAWLFPYNHVNRAAYTTYLPEGFDSKIQRFLSSSGDRPLFLSVHFCLPHWPYQWAAMTEPMDSPPPPFQDSDPHYLAAVKRADGQFGTLLRALERNGRLEHAIVVVLSDHGESFLLAKDQTRPVNPQGTSAAADLPGHGTDVTSLAQYHVLFAFRSFAAGKVRPGVRQQRASVTDVAPTLSALLLSPADRKFDGRSLQDLLSDDTLALQPPRPFFLESGFSIPAILTLNPSATEVFHEGARYYDIGKSGRLTVRRDTRIELMRNKQRAVVLGDWMLAVLPGSDDAPATALVDLKSGRWWTPDDWHASTGPVDVLADALCQQYRADPGFVDGGLCAPPAP